ncbi:MAG: aminotransferase class III-fold pyridoxal phosphate-dependent enzyme [Actinomycetota bacterium]|nr:aminotransferase class III-fold pyridoxal phosphate-dependent enzyme [Actinomycetota bacterium]
MASGHDLWRRAKERIPGGSMLLSKRAEMYLPQKWPAYFDRTEGCQVWDLDGTRYLDLGFMGVGTNILGYSHPAVDAAVRAVIDKGNLSTLNAPEEVYLAERLVELHPWADMARFARSGGEACAIAVRIARAASGRDGIAFCGYHGWHDWYLAANLSDDSLDGHLLPGLEPTGVPRALAGTSHTFPYNDLPKLEALLQQNPDIGVIFMEPQRSAPPLAGFLEGVRELATRHNAVLIFDECTSGFRRPLGGLHLDLGVEPDIATFGKTLGNGYAITAVIGRGDVMQAAQQTFISSTFWTERIGPTAALAAIAEMETSGAPDHIHRIGESVQSTWLELAASTGLTMTVGGLPALASFSLTERDPLTIKTYVTSRMLDQGYLAGPNLYASIAHTPIILESYFTALTPVLEEIGQCDDQELLARLPDGLAQSGFKRLT